MGKTRVAVLYGGQSVEHSVSVTSGHAVIGNFPSAYDVAPVFIRRDGVWTLPEYADDEHRDTVGGSRLISAGASLEGVDVVLPVLHGRGGEDGAVQGLLEMAGLPYVGSGITASAVGIDKEITKRILDTALLPVTPCAVLRPTDMTLVGDARETVGVPAFVKPAAGGSSIGVTRLTDWEDLPAAVEKARKVSSKVLVEPAIDGREVEVGVLEYPDGRVEAATPALVRTSGWYDFDAKYGDGEDTAEVLIPGPLEQKLVEVLKRLAVAAFQTLGCRGLARVDFFVTDDDDVLINEVNTMPGFTEKSVFPRAWHVSGLSFPEMLEVMVETALARP